MQKKILIVIGGDAPDHISIKTSYDLIIAADAGVINCLKLAIKPHEIIGDFDSINQEEAKAAFPDAGQHIFPVDKDHSDTEIAVMRSIEEFGDAEIHLLGGGGGRFDHILEIMILLKKYDSIKKWMFQDNIISRLESKHSYSLKKGQTVSFFAPESCIIEKSEGLQWDLSGRELSPDFMSLSNRLSKDTIKVSIKNGYCYLLQSPGEDSEEYLL